MLSSSQTRLSQFCKWKHQHRVGSPAPPQSQLVYSCTLPAGDTFWTLYNTGIEKRMMLTPRILKLLHLLDRGWVWLQGTEGRGFSALSLSHPLRGLHVLGAWFLFFMGTLFPWETTLQGHPGTFSLQLLEELYALYPYTSVQPHHTSKGQLLLSHSREYPVLSHKLCERKFSGIFSHSPISFLPVTLLLQNTARYLG